ncbi:uncharacterized protein LOC128391613 [Panonychus citri]|uniref:uncharacterized protein LOC128391613 n=1 Tax=Panonychus citri TaxID=50023 RepID=UPI002307F21E|nr:uncharacterized protein LOC128391613 [Panonychus citri]
MSTTCLSTDNSTCLAAINEIKDKIIEMNLPKTRKKDVDFLLSKIQLVLDTLNNPQPTTANADQSISQKILDKLESLTTPSTTPTYSHITASRPSPITIIIKSKTETTTLNEINEKLRSAIKTNPEVRTEYITNSPNGIRVTSMDKKIQSKVSDLLMNILPADSFTVDPLQKLNPQIEFTAQTDQIESIEMFKKRNDIDQNEEVIFVHSKELRSPNNIKTKWPRTKVIVRMTRTAREQIEKKGKIYIGGEGVKFYDNYNVRCCYKCHQVGHTAKFCAGESQCGKCHATNSHSTSDCTFADTFSECLFCKNAGFQNTKHRPRTANCASFNQAIEKIKNITDWNNGSNN